MAQTRRRFPRLDDPGWLRQRYLIEQRTTYDIAAEVGCSDSSVYLAMKAHGIKARSTGHRVNPLKPKACASCGSQFEPTGPAARYCAGCPAPSAKVSKGVGRRQQYRRPPNPLTPDEIPKKWRHTFRFDTQRQESFEQSGKVKRRTVVDRICDACGAQFRSSATQVRADLKRNRGLRGLCKGCADTPGPHHDGRRLKTGLYKHSSGYIEQWVPEKRSYELQHRLVMEQILGRPLTENENVHHRNGRRDDNRPENLELWKRSHPAGVRAVDYHCFGCRCAELDERGEWKLASIAPDEQGA